jgi:hypothetical protein
LDRCWEWNGCASEKCASPMQANFRVVRVEGTRYKECSCTAYRYKVCSCTAGTYRVPRSGSLRVFAVSTTRRLAHRRREAQVGFRCGVSSRGDQVDSIETRDAQQTEKKCKWAGARRLSLKRCLLNAYCRDQHLHRALQQPLFFTPRRAQQPSNSPPRRKGQGQGRWTLRQGRWTLR